MIQKKTTGNFVPKFSGNVPHYGRLIFAIGGCALPLLLVLLSKYVNIRMEFLALILCGIYLGALTVYVSVTTRAGHATYNKNLSALMEENAFGVLADMPDAALIFDSYGTLLWFNDAAGQTVFVGEDPLAKNLSELFSINQNGTDGYNVKETARGDRLYDTNVFCLSRADAGLFAMVLSDKTAHAAAIKSLEDKSIAVAYVTIDSMEDFLQSVQESFRMAVVSVDAALKKWAADMNGVIKLYDNDKYVIYFERAFLDNCINDRFSILDVIRSKQIGDAMSVTVSIGVCAMGETLAQRDAAAKEAIDLALARGGDQAVLKGENGVEYYGGRTKSVYKRSNLRSRSFVSQLNTLMVRSDNVLIMGHRFGDFDSFGSAVGVARLAMSCGVKVHIAVDMRDPNLTPLIRSMQEVAAFAHVFVDSAEGLDLVNADTLMILCDVNTVERVQFTQIGAKVTKIAVIDHHRKIENTSDRIVLSYIDPSASSACELVTELLDCAALSRNITKAEADMLLSGILLDTKQFTRNTGTRTFSAAQILRSAGANPSDVYDFFKIDPSDLSKEARFHTDITIYRENIAISCCDEDTDESYRIIASKAADKMLTLKKVEAAFALVRIGEQIHISGRSCGRINVQLILEQLHGGGHFDVAGAQVPGASATAVLERLKNAIDTYLDSMA